MNSPADSRPAGAAVTDQRYWDQSHAAAKFDYRPEQCPYHRLFGRFLTPYADGTVLEVGFCPGRFLVHFAREFRMRPFGIDYTESFDRALDFMRQHGLPTDGLVKADFFQWQSPALYDVVCSFGFVEHFPDYDDTVARHFRLCRDGGLVMIGVPRFTGLRALFLSFFDKGLMKTVIPAAMSVRNLEKAVQRAGGTVLWSGYDGTCALEFAQNPPPRGTVARRIYNLFVRVTKTVERRVYWPNRLLSPYALVVARKEPRHV